MTTCFAELCRRNKGMSAAGEKTMPSRDLAVGSFVMMAFADLHNGATANWRAKGATRRATVI
jgi:hypothetical protein